MFFLLILQVQSLDSESCKEIACDSTISPYCIKTSSTLIKVSSCKSSQTCPLESSDLSDSGSYVDRICEPSDSESFSCYQNFGTGKSPTGWKCCEDSNCLSNNCTEEVCIGKTYNEKCDKSGECSVGLYCDDFCIDSKLDGKICDQDEECAVGSGCNSGFCTKLFSLDIGESAENEKFCLSFFVYENVCDALEVRIYEDSEEVTAESNNECMIGSKCNYYLKTSGDLYKTKNCLCKGILESKDNNGYCPFIDGLGSVDLIIHLDYNSSSCSGDLSHTSDAEYLFHCSSISKFDYYFYTNITTQRKYWNLYQSDVINSCSKKMGLFYPSNYFESHSLKLVLSLILLIL